MSHFVAVVTGANYEQALDPYWEVDLPVEEMVKDWRVKVSDSYTKKEALEMLLGSGTKEDLDSYMYQKYKCHWYPNLGRFIRYSIPNAKWDWYELGGRWDGYFNLKSGGHSNSAKVKDIDFDLHRKEAAEAAEIIYNAFDKALEGKFKRVKEYSEYIEEGKEMAEARRLYLQQEPIANIREALARRKREFTEKELDILRFKEYDNRFLNKEQYLQASEFSDSAPFAVLHNGEWKERGEMRMFGIVGEESDPEKWGYFYHGLIRDLDPETVLNAIDCHI